MVVFCFRVSSSIDFFGFCRVSVVFVSGFLSIRFYSFFKGFK